MKKKLYTILTWLAGFCLTVVVLDAAVIAFFSFVRPPIPKTDAAIILGAAINTPSLTNRSLQGLALYEQGKASELILSGGRISDEDISEAAYMQKVIAKNDSAAVPEIIEDRSHTTYENIKNSKELAPNVHSVIIVSDGFHLARGVIMALREGFYPVYWSAPMPYYYTTQELLYYYFREWGAMIDYIPKFIFG